MDGLKRYAVFKPVSAGGQHKVGHGSLTVDADNDEFSFQAFYAYFLSRFHGTPGQISVLDE